VTEDGAFEVQGTWWLPSDPDRTVKGTLTFSLEDGARLSLIGLLRHPLSEGERTEGDGFVQIEMPARAIEQAGRYPRIHGQAGNIAYTLEDCFRTSYRVWGSWEDGYEVLHVNRILRGAWFQQGEALEASGISIDIEHLSRWVLDTGIRESISWRDDGGLLEEAGGQPRFELKAFDIPEKEAELKAGARVSLVHRLGIDGDRLDRRSLTQSFQWRIDLAEGQRQPMEDLLDLASDLQDLVSIAIARPARFRSVRFWHPDLDREGSDGQRYQEAVDFYARWNVRAPATGKPVERHQLLFTFDQFGGIEGIKRWMDTVAPHRSGLGRVAGTIYSDGTFVADRLLNCAAALEAFDRERTGHKNSKFKTRIDRCATLAGQPFEKLVGDVSEWLGVVRVERDDVAHHFGIRSRTSGTETYDLWRSLFYLYVLCLLREAAAPEGVFTQIQEHADYISLMDRLKDLI
jgi:hypothetical protein